MNDQRRRVLFLCSPERFGADTWVHALVMRSLDRARFDVRAACTRGTASWDALASIPGLELRHTDFGPTLAGRSRTQQLGAAFGAAGALVSLAGLARYIRRERIELLHATDRPRDAVTCAALSAVTGARSVIHVHVKYNDWMSAQVRWALRRADALIGVSDFVARSLTGRGFRSERVFRVPNAIEPDAWHPALQPGPVRAELGLAPDAPVIASVARLFRWKGHDELIRAVALVRRELPRVRLVIAGADDALAGGAGFGAELRALSASLGLADCVVFAGQRGDVAGLLAAADVFALASFEEPFGLVFAEAMAMRKPVVALDSGGAPEVIEQGKTGLLSPPKDTAALAANLLALLRDPALRARFGEAGRARVERLFAPRNLAFATAAVYDALVPAPRAALQGVS